MDLSEPPRIEAIDRALRLLTALGQAGPGGAQLAELANQVGCPKATAYRALSTLRHRGFAEQDGDAGLYRLGPAALALGDHAIGPQSLARALRPALEALSTVTQETVHLGMLFGSDIVYVDKVEPDLAIRVWSWVGQRVPVATTSLGLALLAAGPLPQSRLEGFLGNNNDAEPSLGEETRQTFRQAIARARKLGYSIEKEANQPGVGCVGAAILSSKRPVASLSITMPVERLTAKRERELAQLIVEVVPPLLPENMSLPAELLRS